MAKLFPWTIIFVPNQTSPCGIHLHKFTWNFNFISYTNFQSNDLRSTFQHQLTMQRVLCPFANLAILIPSWTRLYHNMFNFYSMHLKNKINPYATNRLEFRNIKVSSMPHPSYTKLSKNTKIYHFDMVKVGVIVHIQLHEQVGSKRKSIFLILTSYNFCTSTSNL